ncbi:MAG: PilX N-terminal domain-containing pilus assembly protein [Candidatus Omnitrophota bacterium]
MMRLRPKRSIALVTVLLFMLLVTIAAAAALSLMTKQARLAEHQIRRIKAFYAAESALNKAYQALQANGTAEWTEKTSGIWVWNGQGFEWNVNDAGDTRLVAVRYDTTSTPPGQLSATVNYGP